MAAPTPYFFFPGTARNALEYYRSVFGGEIALHTFEEFERADGPSDAIAHGTLNGPVDLCAADAADGEHASPPNGLVLSLLGAAEPSTLRTWYAHLAAEGEVVDELRRRPWGGSDGQVRDRYGVTWLIGYEHGTRAGETDDGFDLTQDWRV
jgi:PhnB protein